MKNLKDYNKFVQSLENIAVGGMIFHHIENFIYITDSTRKLIGIWNLTKGLQEKSNPLLK